MSRTSKHPSRTKLATSCNNEQSPRMRSPREIVFRLIQEVRNAIQFAFPPRLSSPIETSPLPLPDAIQISAELRQTAFAAKVLAMADDILSGDLPVFGTKLSTGPDIDWRKDYVRQVSTSKKYFRFIPYLDANLSGDHKNIWELSRHQHLVLLAQAYRFANRRSYIDEIETQLSSWWSQNPFNRGINWTSALEVAFRAVSWLWVDHLIGPNLSTSIRDQLLGSLFQHAKHLQNNLSIYFSPNTHLLGEAVVLHALGLFFSPLEEARGWCDTARHIVDEQIQKQVRDDGGHFEQSTYYHVYALDMFLFHAALVRDITYAYRSRLRAMATFLTATMGPERNLPFLGDDDGGRWFHPYGERALFGRATLATCATVLRDADLPFDNEDLFSQASWWLGVTEARQENPARKSTIFPQTGIAVLESDTIHAIFDFGPFGPGGAGHSHSDTLNLVLSFNRKHILVDSGTFTYVGDPQWRNVFRGTSAHNTIKINDRDQAIPSGPFRWSEKPDVSLIDWSTDESIDDITGQCKYGGFTHRRRIHFRKPSLLLILDTVTGPAGEHLLDQTWHLASADSCNFMAFGSSVIQEPTWHSRTFGHKEPAVRLSVKRRTTLPAHFATLITKAARSDCQITENQMAAAFTIRQDERDETIILEWPMPEC